jgi:NTP pyrophosphatase (non-canonical NTP hydrolase)
MIEETKEVTMTTDTHSIAVIQAAVREFRDAREWRQFHSPKNLSMSIAIEAAELMEHFQWLTPEQATALTEAGSPARQAVAEELADVLIYCLSLADILECDVAEIVFDKLAKSAQKYPTEQYRGRF